MLLLSTVSAFDGAEVDAVLAEREIVHRRFIDWAGCLDRLAKEDPAAFAIEGPEEFRLFMEEFDGEWRRGYVSERDAIKYLLRMPGLDGESGPIFFERAFSALPTIDRRLWEVLLSMARGSETTACILSYPGHVTGYSASVPTLVGDCIRRD